MAFLEQELYTLKGTVRDSCFSQDVLLKSHDLLSAVPQEQRTKEVDKLQAEVCYLLARDLKQSDEELGRKYAEEAISLYEKIDIQSFEDAAPVFWEKLPDQMHEGVVKSTLKEILQGEGC